MKRTHSGSNVTPMLTNTYASQSQVKYGMKINEHFPLVRVGAETGESMELRNHGKIIRCVLNLSDPKQWAGDEGKADLGIWASSDEYAAGCTSRAAEIIKRHEALSKEGYHIQIVVSNITASELKTLRSVQTQRYKDFQQINGQVLPEDYILPVTFVALEAQSRESLANDHGYPKFEKKYKGGEFLAPHTFVLDENKITFSLKHSQVDLKTFDAKKADNVCAQDAEKVLEAVKVKAGLGLNNT